MPQNTTAQGRKTIYIIRHGQTDFNKRGVVQGSGIDSDLNETGKLQAEGFFEMYGDVPFSRIFTSKLKRTVQTVAPFAERNIPLESLSELNEINWGIMEGAEPSPTNHDIFVKTLAEWRNGNLDYAVERGETPNEMYSRQKGALRRILDHETTRPVLVCMHGRAMRSFLCLLTGTPLAQMDDFEHGNVCLYILDRTENSNLFTIRVRNSRQHLHHHLHS